MYAALTFDEKLFPGRENIHLWLANQTGEKLAALGELAARGKYAVAHCRGRRCNFVYRLCDLKGGNVPKLAECKDGVTLDEGVTAYAAK
jgi:hypothetical protein